MLEAVQVFDPVWILVCFSTAIVCDPLWLFLFKQQTSQHIAAVILTTHFEQPHRFDILIRIERKTVVYPSWYDDKIARVCTDADPLISGQLCRKA